MSTSCLGEHRLAPSVLWASMVLALLAAPAAAQLHLNQSAGAGIGFGDGAPDGVSPFNGSLSIRIPIGGTYPVGGSFAYGLSLVYTGNVWDFQEVCTSGVCKTQAIPGRRSNAGLGWTLSLGRLYPPTSDPQSSPINTSNQWLLISADGSDHLFYSTLHAGESSDTGFRYTRDGSYMRMKDLAGGLHEIEMPDGEIHKFGADNRIVQIRDRYGNRLDVTYPTSTTWVLKDNFNRTQTITFQSDATFGQVVKSVALTAFNGGTATYNFSYAPPPQTIERGCPHTDTSIGNMVQVTLLTGVTLTLPAGVTHGYTIQPTDYLKGDGVGCDRTSGYITALGLPTGGKVSWTWRSYGFPATGSEIIDSSTGVATRSVSDANGAALGTWSYLPQLISDPDFKIRSTKTTIADPQQHKTVHYFSVALEGGLSAEGWSKYDYGLPFTRNAAATGSTPARYLSTERIDSSGTTQQRTYVRFERDKVSGATNNWDFNRRMIAHRTVYPTDGNRYADVLHSNFDGVGHYRKTILNGSFATGNYSETITEFNMSRGTYQIDPATDAATAAHTYTKWPTGTIWVLNTFDSQSISDGNGTAKTEYCFDFDNATLKGGFLERRRTLASGTTRGQFDVIEEFLRDSVGNPGTVKLFGGDTQAVATNTTLCSLSLPATPQVLTTNTWQNGALASAQISSVSFKSVDRNIDLNTGLVKTSRDSAGLKTDYEYDLLGRVTYAKPLTGHDGWTQYSHLAAGGGTGPQVHIRRRNNGGTVVLAEAKLKFDGLGRLWREETLMPSGTWSARETLYYPGGLIKSVSTLGNSAEKTVYDSYDHFGRPLSITPPDGAAHKTTVTYIGVQTITRKTKVGTGRDAVTGAILETDVNTVFTLDRQGRLHQVFEPANPDGTNSTTTQTYDMLGRLIQITQTAKDASSMPRTQTRTYSYDNRGFLKTEKHPEKGAFGNGTVTYSNYDPRGLPGRVQDGPNDLTFTYDKAGRLTQVKETGASGRVIKSYTYATANGTSNWRNGKLEVARRYNYVMIGTVPYTVAIAETYTYGGRAGRPSKRDTQAYVNGGAFESFTQGWVWNDLGDTGSVTYPKCTHTGCTATTARTVSPTYTNGFLTAVPGYASPITYQVNGMVNQITHLNTPGNAATWVTDTYFPDADNMSRPSKIDSKLGANVTWSSGTYAYDGSGNLVKTGSAYMLYDKVSRVSSGLLYTGAGAGGSTVSFSNTYDGFGNLTGITSGTTRTIAIEWATNRVDTTTGSTQYDSAGNMTRWNSGPTYEYDRLDMMWHMKNGAEDWLYLYTADDERIWSYKPSANNSRWTLRDLDRKVLREYDNLGGTWTIRRDYVYRGRSLVAAHTSDPSPKDLIQFHLDHLGTPRAITATNGTRIAYHLYYPFGEEATGFNQDQERAKFTGHERDLASLGGAGDDLDNMHARFYNGQLGKFLGVDPLRGSPSRPQSLNRYTYVMGNPLRYVDPFGLEPIFPGGGETITVTGTPYRFNTGVSGASQLYYDSFFLQNVSFLISPQAQAAPAPMPSPQPPMWVNPTGNCIRKCDAKGCGHFGAPRDGGSRPHEAADFLSNTGQDVVAPTSGTVTREVGRVYPNDPRYTGFVLSGGNNYQIKGFYVSLDASLIGTQVAAGDVLGQAQDLTLRYPGISNHVHIEITDPNGQPVDPKTLIPTPGCP